MHFFLLFMIIIQLLLTESPELDCPFKILCTDNIPNVEFAVLHTYVYDLCPRGSCISSNACILGGHCCGAAMKFFNDHSHIVGAYIGVRPAAIWIFGKSNNELVLRIDMDAGELLSVCDLFQAVADILIAGRFELRSGHVVGSLDCWWYAAFCKVSHCTSLYDWIIIHYGFFS